jgi:hypothetical protein
MDSVFPGEKSRRFSLPLRVVHKILPGVGIGALIGVGKWVYLQRQISKPWRSSKLSG